MPELQSFIIILLSLFGAMIVVVYRYQMVGRAPLESW